MSYAVFIGRGFKPFYVLGDEDETLSIIECIAEDHSESFYGGYDEEDDDSRTVCYVEVGKDPKYHPAVSLDAGGMCRIDPAIEAFDIDGTPFKIMAHHVEFYVEHIKLLEERYHGWYKLNGYWYLVVLKEAQLKALLQKLESILEENLLTASLHNIEMQHVLEQARNKADSGR